MDTVGLLSISLARLAVVVLGICALWRPQWLAAAIVAALPCFALALKGFPFDPIFPSYETIGVGIAAGFYCIRFALAPPCSRLQLDWSLLGVFLFLAGASLTTIVSTRAVLSGKILLTGAVIPFVCYWIGRFSVQSWSARRSFAIGLLLLAIIVGIYTFATLVLRVGVVGALNPSNLMWLKGDGAINNLFVSPSVGLMTILIALPIGVWFMAVGRWLSRILGVLAIGSVCFVSLFSFSRGGWLFTALAAGVAPLLCFRSWRARLSVLGFGTCGAIVLFAYSNVAADVVSTKMGSGDARFDQAKQQNLENIVGRLQNYASSAGSIVRYPFVGTGLGNYQESYESDAGEQSDAGDELWFAHNLVLTLIVEIGAVGAAGFVLFFVNIIWGRIGRFRGPPDQNTYVRCLVLGVLCVLGMACSTGAHLISHLRPVEQETYFIAPTMIVLFTTCGVLSAIVPEPRRGTRLGRLVP